MHNFAILKIESGIKWQRSLNVNLNMAKKLELVEKLEQGIPVAPFCEFKVWKNKPVSNICLSVYQYKDDCSKCYSTMGNRTQMSVGKAEMQKQ